MPSGHLRVSCTIHPHACVLVLCMALLLNMPHVPCEDRGVRSGLKPCTVCIWAYVHMDLFVAHCFPSHAEGGVRDGRIRGRDLKKLGCRRAPTAPTHRLLHRAPTDPSALTHIRGRFPPLKRWGFCLGHVARRVRLSLDPVALPPLISPCRPCTPHSPPPEIATAANHWGQEKSNPKPPSPSWGNQPVHHLPTTTDHCSTPLHNRTPRLGPLPRQSPRPRYPKESHSLLRTLLPLSPSPFIFRPRVVSLCHLPLSLSLSHLPSSLTLLLSPLLSTKRTKRGTL